MIVRELLRVNEDGTKLYKTYSDNKKKILQVQTGVKYEEAIDVEFAPYTYVETEEVIEKEEAQEQ